MKYIQDYQLVRNATVFYPFWSLSRSPREKLIPSKHNYVIYDLLYRGVQICILLSIPILIQILIREAQLPQT